MIQQEEHIKTIKRFHDTFKVLVDLINNEPSETKKHQFALIYFNVTNRIWGDLDNCIEQLKDTTDNIISEINTVRHLK